MVFDPSAAPRDRKDFMTWYGQQTEWTESHGYNDPDVPMLTLRSWFQDMIKTFPPMNGPLASEDVDDPKLTDYCLGRSVIYAAFAWSEATVAYEAMTVLAVKHRVGFFDVSAKSGEVWLPTPDGGYEKLSG
jgi:hypothetical protein